MCVYGGGGGGGGGVFFCFFCRGGGGVVVVLFFVSLPLQLQELQQYKLVNLQNLKILSISGKI